MGADRACRARRKLSSATRFFWITGIGCALLGFALLRWGSDAAAGAASVLIAGVMLIGAGMCSVIDWIIGADQ